MDIYRNTLASDLIMEDVRCKIRNVNSENVESYITIFNIKGDRRTEVLSELTEVMGDGELDMDKFNLFYSSLVIEFTDLVINTEDVIFLLNDSTLTGKRIVQELNDMIYELQYEVAMNQLAMVRNVTLNLMMANSLEEVKYAEDRVETLKKSPMVKKDEMNKKVKQQRRRNIK